MKAYLFPGQGAQTTRMAGEIIEEYPEASAFYKEAQNITGLDLTKLCEEDIAQTRYSQPAIVVHSVASLHKEIAARNAAGADSASDTISAETSEPIALAGFSLGEYTALYAAGVLNFTDLLRLVDVRARRMQEAAEKNPGAMYAVIGLSEEEIESRLRSRRDVYPVNYNCPGQLVIAGLEKPAEEAAAELLSAGARRVMRLAVNGAFHTPLMAEAAAHLREFAKTLDFSPLNAPLYSNASASRVPATTDWSTYLENHAVSPVRFTEEIRAMREDGFTTFTELGPGKVLTGLAKKI